MVNITKLLTKYGLLILMMLFVAKPSLAGNNLLNVQGKLTNSSFVALSGTYTVTFRLYANISDAVGSALWTESKSVYVSTGLFNVTLGTSTSMNAINFNQPYYLGMQVAGDSNELFPRQLLGASAYALGSLGNFYASGNIVSSGSITAAGSISASNMTIASFTITTASVTNLTVTQTLTASSVIASSGTLNSFMVVGSTTNNDAPYGRLGEYIVANAAAQSAGTTGQWNDLTSISLSPGDWDVSGIGFAGIDSGTWFGFQVGISTSSGTSGYGLTAGYNEVESYWASTGTAIQEVTLSIPTYRVSINTTTTMYLKRMNLYSGANRTWGRISARRVR